MPAAGRDEPNTCAQQSFRALSHAAWKRALEAELDCEVRLVGTRSRKRPLQLRVLRRARPERGLGELIELRLHPIFDEAPSELHGAVASWIRSGARARRACRSIDEWIQSGLERVPPPLVRPETLRTRGATHDLAPLAEELRRAHFAAQFPEPASLPPITWGRSSGPRARRSLRLGSCDPDGRLVRIHPVLDQPGVPEYFVRFVLHHELLHAVIPPYQAPSGRWVHHGREFRLRERAYPDYERARRWEDRHMGELLRSVRRGVPLALREPARAEAVAAARAGAESGPRTGRAAARAPARGESNVLQGLARIVQRVLFPA